MVGAEILKVVYAKLGMPIEIVAVSGRRALIESSEGRLDGEVNRIIEIDSMYPSLLKIPTAINHIESTVFSKNISFSPISCSSLEGKLVGIVIGVMHAELCTKGQRKMALFPDSVSLMKSLDKNIVDYVVTARFNGLVQLKKLGINSIMALKPALSKKALFHYLHKKHADLIPKVNSVIIAMAKSGELNLIRQKRCV